MSAPLPPGAPALAGREREQIMLRDALAAALAGRGSLVLIGGEAGIGKTTLAEWSLAEVAADQSALVLVGRCYDLTETPPYGPWAEALARAPRGDALPTPPDLAGGGAASQGALIAAVRDYLAALTARQPLALLLDDLHWADPASLDLLRTVARDLAALPTLLLVTYRDDELTRRHPLYALLPLLEREAHAIRLDVRRLAAAALAALVDARYILPTADAKRLVAWLYGRAEGNAFFTAQLLRALEDAGTLAATSSGWALGDLGAVGLPAPLRQVLDARVDRLGEDARELLALAAVIGQEVPLDLWATVAGTDEDGLLGTIERAVGARLLTGSTDGRAVRFAHALIREALYESTLPMRRRRQHRLTGEALAAASPDPDAVAYHFQRAGDPRAAEWLIRAGERAQRTFALATAAARYQAALALLPDDDTQASERGWLLTRIGFMLRYVDQHQAVAAYAEARSLALWAGDRALAALALCDLGLYRGNRGQRRQGLAEYAAGLAEMEALSQEDRARLDRRAATGQESILPHRRRLHLGVLALGGRCAEVLALAERHLGAAVPAERAWPSGYADACQGLGTAHALLGHPEVARCWFAEAQRGFRAVGHLTLAAFIGYCDLSLALLVATPERLAERERVAREAVEAGVLAREVGAMRAEPRVVALPLWLVTGHWTEARAVALAALEFAPQGGNVELTRLFLGWLAWVQGDSDLAREQVRAVFPDGPQPAPTDLVYMAGVPLLRLAAALALDAADPEAARAWLETHDQWLAWSGARLGLTEGALGWAEYHRAVGDGVAARERAEVALAHAAQPRQPLAQLAAHRALGELDADASRFAEAQAHLAEALVLADACAAPYERALTLLALAELHLATGDRDRAHTALTLARDLLEPLEARPALARAEAIAARLAPGDVPTSAYPAGLSAREVEVLRLVASGLTNAQTAERLFLSPRTVDQHLRSIYNKVGVSSRAAASRWAAERNLTGEAP